MTNIELSKPMVGLCRWAMRAALLGLALSVLVHVMNFFQPVSLDAALPLHLGAMVLGVPMVVAASVAGRDKAGFSWLTALKACPPHFRYGAVACIAYGFGNFLALFTQQIPDLQGLSAIWQCGYASIAVVYYALGKQQSA